MVCGPRSVIMLSLKISTWQKNFFTYLFCVDLNTWYTNDCTKTKYSTLFFLGVARTWKWYTDYTSCSSTCINSSSIIIKIFLFTPIPETDFEQYFFFIFESSAGHMNGKRSWTDGISKVVQKCKMTEGYACHWCLSFCFLFLPGGGVTVTKKKTLEKRGWSRENFEFPHEE